jgi:hypothetical protein
MAAIPAVLIVVISIKDAQVTSTTVPAVTVSVAVSDT